MQSTTKKSEKCPGINFRLFPIKVHYFFLFGAIAGALPFMPIFGKDLGLSATAVGITYTLLPMCIFIFKPVFGYLADYSQNIKTLVVCFIIVTATVLFSLLFVRPLRKDDNNLVQTNLACSNDETYLLPFEHKETCTKMLLPSKVRCEIVYINSNNSNSDAYRSMNISIVGQLHCYHGDNLSNKENRTIQENSTFDNCFVLLKGNVSEVQRICTRNRTALLFVRCDYIDECLLPKSKFALYKTYQFWVYTLLIVTAGTATTTAMTLTDVACYEILGENKESYGRQRLWGTIGTGVVTLVTGYLNDVLENENENDYSAGIYIMTLLSIINLIVLALQDFPKSKISKHIISDVSKLFKSPEIIIYAIAVFIIGNFSGLIANFLFWYLRELGAKQTLLGLAVTVQTVVAEVPFFFFAGWFIKRLGYFSCLTCSFAAFALRFGLYSIIKNPWQALPVETLHGVTFAVFYASKTAFASTYAPPGTEGTLLGILGGLCDGLGFASGSLLGGLSFDSLGGSRTFCIASVLSLACVPACLFLKLYSNSKTDKKEITSAEDQQRHAKLQKY